MKKLLCLLGAIALSTTLRAQGTINFYNNNLTGPTGTYRAGIFLDYGFLGGLGDPKGDTTVGAGAGYTAGLFLASDLTHPLATTLFRTTTATEVFASFIPDVPVPGVPPGSVANLVVAAWNTDAGSFQNAKISGFWGNQAFTSRPLGGPNPDPTQPAIPSPDLGPGFTGFEIFVPEPSALALLAAGIGALLARHRKKFVGV